MTVNRTPTRKDEGKRKAWLRFLFLHPDFRFIFHIFTWAHVRPLVWATMTETSKTFKELFSLQSCHFRVAIADLTREEVIAQSIAVILGGYDTTAIAISFLVYNLAVNPDIQEKLHLEIINVAGDKVGNQKKLQLSLHVHLRKCFDRTASSLHWFCADLMCVHDSFFHGRLKTFSYWFTCRVNQNLTRYSQEIDYSALCEMNLLDMCCRESLRIYPPVIRCWDGCSSRIANRMKKDQRNISLLLCSRLALNARLFMAI